MPRFRFSLFRLFMAVTVFCGAFGFVKAIGAPWPICPWLIGVPMAMLMLVVTWDDERTIYAVLMSCGTGAMLIGPMGFAATNPSRFGQASGPVAMLVGAVLGWLIGLLIRFAIYQGRDIAEEEHEDLYDEEMLDEIGVGEKVNNHSGTSNSTKNAVSDVKPIDAK